MEIGHREPRVGRYREVRDHGYRGEREEREGGHREPRIGGYREERDSREVMNGWGRNYRGRP